jgi:hypothetical protein
LLLLGVFVSDEAHCRSGFSRDLDNGDGKNLSQLKPLLQKALKQQLPLTRVTFLCLCKEK